MPRFLRKSSDKQNNGKPQKPEKGKKKESKKQAKKPDVDPAFEDGEDDTCNGIIGVLQCKKLLATCPQRRGAKCMATFRRQSQLSKGLMEILLDDSVLPYFMEYMQKHNATDLLSFWLTSETFRLSTTNRLKINSISRLKQSNDEHKMTDSLGQTPGSSLTAAAALSNSCTAAVDGGHDNDSGDEFGCFTGYTVPNDQGLNSSSEECKPDIVTVCDYCDNRTYSSPTGMDVCAKCGNNRNAESSFTSRDSLPGKQTNSGCMACEVSSASKRKSNVLGTSGPGLLTLSDKNPETRPERSPSRVTFDLEPDYENRQREFCRRRTRSIVIDAVSIYSKYISLEASHPLTLDENLRRQIESNISSEDGKIDPECFVPAQKFVFSVMEKMYFPSFRQSSYYSKHQIDILTSGNVFLSDILYNETSVFYFMEFLEQEGVQHVLEFWLSVDNFQSHLQSKLACGTYNSEESLGDAMVLYDKYFSMQARVPLGVDDVTRIDIENSICREGGPLPDCFALPMEHILYLLEEIFFPNFLRGDVYFKYLTELLNSVSERPVMTSASSAKAANKKGHSDESSRLVTSYGSDLDLTENPDAIWHRPNAGPLSLGRVNEFGIFEPIFEPGPDSGNGTSTASKLGKAMRKLVSSGEDKAKEEMAWKIAKMIIEDVQTQQQGGESGDMAASEDWSTEL